MCVGSYASRVDNEVEKLVKDFAEKINFVHLRNVRKVGDDSFVESDHIDGDVDMFSVLSTLLHEQDRRKKIGVRHEGNSIITLQCILSRGEINRNSPSFEPGRA